MSKTQQKYGGRVSQVLAQREAQSGKNFLPSCSATDRRRRLRGPSRRRTGSSLQDHRWSPPEGRRGIHGKRGGEQARARRSCPAAAKTIANPGIRTVLFHGHRRLDGAQQTQCATKRPWRSSRRTTKSSGPALDALGGPREVKHDRRWLHGELPLLYLGRGGGPLCDEESTAGSPRRAGEQT
jgi:hypothetical protein